MTKALSVTQLPLLLAFAQSYQQPCRQPPSPQPCSPLLQA